MPASRRLASPESGVRSRLRWPRLADARIRSKLGLILVIPVLAIATLAVLRLGDANRQAQDAELVGALTELSARASAVAHELHRERMTAAVALAVPTTPIDAFTRQTTRTVAAVDGFTATRRDLPDVPGGVRDRLQRIDLLLGSLTALRKAVTARQGVSLSEVVLRYGLVITELVSYRESLSQVTADARLANALIAAAAFSKAKLLVGAQEAIVYPALGAKRLDEQQYSAFIATLTGQQEALVTFSLAANAGQRGRVEAAIAGDAVQLADNITSELRRSVSGPATVTAEEASSALSAVNELMRGAEQQLDADLLSLTSATIEDVRRQVLIEAAVIIIVVVLLIALAVSTAQSMARALRRLRQGALLVAEHRLAEAVERLRDADSLGQRTPAEIAAGVPDVIGIRTRDEIGEVAQAFHVVHREAVRIAAEQAALRASVSAMFLNLARRSQTLVDRMIAQLDGIEREEQDPGRLAQMFKLDHLATRMRRNDENVLVLAGADTAPPRQDDAPLADVIRAAQSEVELYERIEFGFVEEEVSIAAHAVNDVVRLLAELLDNATRFSPPHTSVYVEGRRAGDGGYIRIEDRGLGMSPEEAAAHNERLAAPPTIDVNTLRMMGLAVVSRLAYRHGIGVRLLDNAGGGTVAALTLQPNVVVLPRSQLSVSAMPFAGRRYGDPASHATTVHAHAPAYAHPAPATGPQPAVIPSSNGTGGGYGPGGPPTTWPTFPVSRPAELPARPTPALPADLGPPAAPTELIPVHPTFLRESTSDRWADLTPAPVEETAASAHPVDPDDTTELPIFREIQATWFRVHGHGGTDGWPIVEPVRPPDRAAAPTESVASTPAVAPQPDPDDGDIWRTRADAGWRAAAAASNPPIKDRTRSGLPKRQPRAQLVPGGVGERPAARPVRSAEETRGRLSAYHRGVQRGRAFTAAESTTTEGNF